MAVCNRTKLPTCRISWNTFKNTWIFQDKFVFLLSKQVGTKSSLTNASFLFLFVCLFVCCFFKIMMFLMFKYMHFIICILFVSLRWDTLNGPWTTKDWFSLFCIMIYSVILFYICLSISVIQSMHLKKTA